MKFCNGCQTSKELTDFHKRADGPGVRSKCKKCCYNQNQANVDKKRTGPKRQKLTPEQQKESRKQSLKKHRQSASYKVQHATRNAWRRAQQAKATPPWLTADQQAHIAAYYELAHILTKTFGIQMDVDHIMPLKGKNGSGLHVPWNLQILEHKANCAKGNRLNKEDDNG